jgi:hypothetical protein
MSNGERSNGERRRLPIGDAVALKVQELHSQKRLRGDQPLLRIDQRAEAARAPYQFDTAKGRLHRLGCTAIPRSSRSALYGVWRIGPEEEKLGCPECKPVAERADTGDDTFSTDVLYGVLSILDQFAGVLRERGREYRSTRQGRRVRLNVEGLARSLGTPGKDVLQVLVSTLDNIIRTVQDLEQNLTTRNGENGARGHNGRRPADMKLRRGSDTGGNAHAADDAEDPARSTRVLPGRGRELPRDHPRPARLRRAEPDRGRDVQ